MIIKNAIKKLSKLGKIERNEHEAWITLNNRVISFMANGRWDDNSNIVCINVRGINDQDDPTTDYSAGSFYPTLASAIKIVQRIGS